MGAAMADVIDTEGSRGSEANPTSCSNRSRNLDMFGRFDLPKTLETNAHLDKNGVKLPQMKSYIQRSFSIRYNIDPDVIEVQVEDRINDKYAYLHPNGICVLGIAPTHSAIQVASSKGLSDLSINFNAKWSVSSFQFEGKRRRNAVIIHEGTELCTIRTHDASFTVRSFVKGKLLELNSSLLDSPQLLIERPAMEGWIAVIQLNKNEVERLLQKSMTCDEYFQKRCNVLKVE